MNFRYEMNNQLNQLPDEIRNTRSVRIFADSIVSSYETFISWVGTNAIQLDINWNHIGGLLRGIISVHPDNITSYIENFRLNEEYNHQEDNDGTNASLRFERQNDYNDEGELWSNSDDESDDNSDDDSDDNSDDNSDDDSETEINAHEESVWACNHCRHFIGDYETVCAHEDECPENPSNNEAP